MNKPENEDTYDESTMCTECGKDCITKEYLKKHMKCVHKSDREFEEYSTFLKRKQANLSTMNPNELFALVQEIQAKDPLKNK